MMFVLMCFLIWSSRWSWHKIGDVSSYIRVHDCPGEVLTARSPAALTARYSAHHSVVHLPTAATCLRL